MIANISNYEEVEETNKAKTTWINLIVYLIAIIYSMKGSTILTKFHYITLKHLLQN